MSDDDDLFAVRPVKAPRKRSDVALKPAEKPFRANPGRCPPEARGKRVIVRLASGRTCGLEPVTTVTPTGWAADGPQGCRWSLTGQPFDIAEYRLA